jgi:DNA-binding NarL/FixJ family response regulator
MIKVLLVDDQATVRRGLRMRLALEPDVEVIGEAGDGHAAIAEARRLGPDVVVMDVKMPSLDGITAGSLLLQDPAAPAIVILTLHDGPDLRSRAKSAGMAFVGKHEADSQLLPAIRQMAKKGQSGV